jgi:hypothetical protein
MISKTNIETQLFKIRSKRITEDDLLIEIQNIFSENKKEREHILQKLKGNRSNDNNSFNIELLDSQQIFHCNDIKKTCVNYRLRFLDSHFFKGDFPEEAISKIRALENQHQTKLHNFKVMAPAKRLKLENADDPLLFVPIGNDYFYLIHKWGNDLHPFRKLLMWPYRSFENLVFTLFLLSILLTALAPIHLFSPHGGIQEYVLLFLFIFKGVAGTTLFYGFAKGKNFNPAIWDSKYYNA